MEADCHKVELRNRSQRIAVGHPQMRHRIQRRTPDQHLRRLPSKLPRTDAVSEDRLHSKHLRLGQAAPMIPYFLLPLLTPHLANSSQMLIANQSLFFTIAVLPDPSIAARRDGRLGFSFPDRLITIALVIGAIAADLLDLRIDLLKQVFEYLRIGDVVSRHHGGNDLTGGLIGTNVQLAPSAAFRVAVLTNFPF